MASKARTVDPQQVSPYLVRALLAFLVAAGLVGVAFLDQYSPLPTTELLDAWIVAFIGMGFLRGRTARLLLIFTLGGYLLTRLIPGWFDGDPLFDLLQAYRWVLYLIAFVMAIGRRWGPSKNLRALTLGLIGLALAKAVAVFAILGPGERPGLFIENNFEIALFCGLLVTQHRDLSTVQRIAGIGMLATLMVLSGSRSGAISFAILVMFALFQVRTTLATKIFVGAYALPAVAAVPVLVFIERQAQAGGGRIDRLNFLDVFLSETSTWSVVNWLVGTEPITPLSPVSCGRLSYYENLFSSAGDGSCYSVIMHAFVLRVIFDAGLFGLVLAFVVPWFAMRAGGVQTSIAVAILAIAGANSLSVSGLNNPYVAFPIIVAILMAGNARHHGEVADIEARQAARAYR